LSMTVPKGRPDALAGCTVNNETASTRRSAAIFFLGKITRFEEKPAPWARDSGGNETVVCIFSDLRFEKRAGFPSIVEFALGPIIYDIAPGDARALVAVGG